MKRTVSLLLAMIIATVVMAQKKPVTHHAVDLGLPSGTMWATCNIGALSPEQYGNYFSWGEIIVKKNFSLTNAQFYNKDIDELRKKGAVDYNNRLAARYDVATQKWGAKWSMPTKEQIEELKKLCSFKKSEKNGVKGCLVTGPNNNTIFIPFSGSRIDNNLYNVGTNGEFWSSSVSSGATSNTFLFDSWGLQLSSRARYIGYCVRPVMKKTSTGTSVASVKKETGIRQSATTANTTPKTSTAPKTSTTSKSSTTSKTSTGNTQKANSRIRRDSSGNPIYDFYQGLYIIGGKELPGTLQKVSITVRYNNITTYQVYKNGKDFVRTCSFKSSDDKGSYYESKENGLTTIWFISNNHNFAYMNQRSMFSDSSTFYYSSEAEAKLHSSFASSNGGGSSGGFNNVGGNNGGNNTGTTTSSKKQRQGCRSCAIAGGDGYAGNGQCRGCSGSGTRMILGEIRVCPNCHIKYETRGNGACQWCKGTGWRD